MEAVQFVLILNTANRRVLTYRPFQYSFLKSSVDSIQTATVMDRLARDKKFKSGKIRFVTLSEIGNAQVIESVTLADLEATIDHLRS